MRWTEGHARAERTTAPTLVGGCQVLGRGASPHTSGLGTIRISVNITRIGHLILAVVTVGDNEYDDGDSGDEGGDDGGYVDGDDVVVGDCGDDNVGDDHAHDHDDDGGGGDDDVDDWRRRWR